MSREVSREIRLVQYEDGQWSATDEERDVTAEGEVREDALLNLDREVLSTLDDDETPWKRLDEVDDEEFLENIVGDSDVADDVDDLDDEDPDVPDDMPV